MCSFKILEILFKRYFLFENEVLTHKLTFLGKWFYLHKNAE